MKYVIRGSKIEITDSIREYIETKIGKLEKYLNNQEEITANVLITPSGVNQKVEVTIPIKGTILRAENANKDLYASIDLVLEKLERQIRKNKTRMHKMNKDATLFTDFNVEEADVNDSQIVKRKTIETKPMSEEEAMLQMELLDHDFYVFNNEKTGGSSIIYKRKDNQYGLIDIK